MFNLELWWVKPLLGLLAVATLAGGLIWLHHTVYRSGYEAGTRDVKAEFALRDKAAEEAADKERARLQAKKDADEAARRDDLAKAQTQRQKDRINDENTIATLRRDIAAGKRLFDPAARGTVACGGSGVPAPGSSSSGDNGTAGGELSAEATQFLSEEAARANSIVRQLTECQALVASDRKAR